jgi:ADP-ribose pyrophosphatase YjhB (NUDIX family)
MKRETNGILNVSIGAIFKDKKLLLIRRKKEPYAGFWGLAGGKVKFGENFETAQGIRRRNRFKGEIRRPTRIG